MVTFFYALYDNTVAYTKYIKNIDIALKKKILRYLRIWTPKHVGVSRYP